MTEYICNDTDIELQHQFKPDKWQTFALNYLGNGDLAALEYDTLDNTDDYPFLFDGELFDYRFTDEDIAYLSKDTFVDGSKTIEPDKLGDPEIFY